MKKTLPSRIAWRPAELAEMTGYSRSTITRWMNDGTIRTVTLGRSRLIPAAEVERLLGRPIDAGQDDPTAA